MRVVTRIVSAVLALGLFVGGVLAAIEIGSGLLDREEPVLLPWDDWYREGTTTPWDDPEVRLTLVVVLAVGLALLVLLLAPRRATSVPLQHLVDGSDAELDRGGLERWLRARLERVDGVASARVRVRGGRVVVRAVTPARETEPVGRQVAAAADAALGEVGLARPLPVRVAVTSRRES